MQFKKEDLQNLVYDESTVLTKILDKQTGSGRWDIQYDLIFKFEDHYFCTNYSVEAVWPSLMQDVTAFEYDGDLIDCPECWPEIEERVVFTLEDPGYTPEGLKLVEAKI